MASWELSDTELLITVYTSYTDLTGRGVALYVRESLMSISLQESPAVADKHARRESMPKIAPIQRAYNVVADNTGLSSFV